MSFGNMLSQKYKDSLGQTGNDYLNRMLHATQRMQSLLTGLLEYSRVTTNPEPFREVDLYDIVHEVLSDLEIRIKNTKGEVKVAELPKCEIIGEDGIMDRMRAIRMGSPGRFTNVTDMERLICLCGVNVQERKHHFSGPRVSGPVSPEDKVKN